MAFGGMIVGENKDNVRALVRAENGQAGGKGHENVTEDAPGISHEKRVV
jgi:hypothetical protein